MLFYKIIRQITTFIIIHDQIYLVSSWISSSCTCKTLIFSYEMQSLFNNFVLAKHNKRKKVLSKGICPFIRIRGKREKSRYMYGVCEVKRTLIRKMRSCDMYNQYMLMHSVLRPIKPQEDQTIFELVQKNYLVAASAGRMRIKVKIRLYLSLFSKITLWQL